MPVLSGSTMATAYTVETVKAATLEAFLMIQNALAMTCTVTLYLDVP